MKTRKLALNAVLAAMCAALGALALDLNSIKITFESFPILLGALLFGRWTALPSGLWGRFYTSFCATAFRSRRRFGYCLICLRGS